MIPYVNGLVFVFQSYFGKRNAQQRHLYSSNIYKRENELTICDGEGNESWDETGAFSQR